MIAALTTLIGATVAAPPAPAQKVEGSRKQAEVAMADFAACEIRARNGRSAALAFTREVGGTPSDYPARLIKSPCAPRGTSLSFRPNLFRMGLFSALYAQDYAKAPLPDVAGVPALDHTREFDGAPSEATLSLRQFGDCVVRSDAAASRRLVLSKLYSAEEAAAVTALQPALGSCIGEGQQLRFSRSVVHGAVGEALYKLTAAAAATKVN